MSEGVICFCFFSEQMAGVSREKCQAIINKYEPSTEGQEKGHLGIDGEGLMAKLTQHYTLRD